MRLRRYELLTLATARALGCRACMSAHAAMCIKHGVLTTDEVEAILRDFHDARLDDVEVALMDLVEKVATDAQRVTASDVELLRGLGLRDDEIFAAVVVATARCFYSKALEAMGVPRDAALASIRLSLGYASTDSGVDTALELIPRAVEQLRPAVSASR